MDKDSACFPLIPASTVRAARTLYGRGNVYLRLGDRLNELLLKFDPRMIAMQLGGDSALLLSLLTIIQYVEKLTDVELAASIQQRMDLRYAVHLATPSPRLDPHALCVFRSRLLANPEGRCLFQEIVQSIYPEIKTNLTQDVPAVEDVLDSICENVIRGWLMESMLSSMEALSANHFNWLRRIALPHWYQRYHRSIVVTDLVHSIGKQELTREEILGDIQHLLYEIHGSNSHDILEMHEIRDLSWTWEQLTFSKSKTDCDHCIKKHHGKEELH